MLSANDTESEPANAPPSGVMVGVLTVAFFELVPLLEIVFVERLVAVAVLVAVADVTDVDNVPVATVVVLVSAFDG